MGGVGGGGGSRRSFGGINLFLAENAQKGKIRKDSEGGPLKSAGTLVSYACLSYWPQVTQAP